MRRIKNVLEYLEESAEKFPHKIAFADEEKCVTYAQLQENAKRMASGILTMTSPGKPVAVLGEKSVETVTAFLACVYAGCFYVPLNPLHPASRREAIWEKMGFPLLLVQEKCRALLPSGVNESQIATIGNLTDGLRVNGNAEGNCGIAQVGHRFYRRVYRTVRNRIGRCDRESGAV